MDIAGWQKDISELAVRVCKKIKSDPSYLSFLLLDILASVIYFPKYLYYLISRRKIIAFDWGNGIYGDFYLPLFEKLSRDNSRIVFFFHFWCPKRYNMTVFGKGLPKIYENLLDNKVVICASLSKYKKLPRTIRIQMFHGFGSFGSIKQRVPLERFDVLFLASKFQWHQLKEQYKKIAEGKKILCIGYPKIDKYISVEKRRRSLASGNITLFYGPTYHREISSIFEFLPALVEMCRKNNYKLIIKLHPLLCHKRDYDKSGGINWPREVIKYKKTYSNITLYRINKHDLDDCFRMTDVFLTDVSGIGFEFVLATAKPIVFLGEKLKIPLEDLHKGNIERYKNYAEVYYRTRIGPTVTEPSELEEAVKKVIEQNGYESEIEEFRKEFVFNLGTSTDVAVSEIKQIYEEL